MASSSAAWVFGGVRLISSASSSWVKTGPGRKTISPLRWSYSGAPTTSDGSRSGVNWMRAKSRPSTLRERPRDERLAQAGQVLEEHVAAGQDADQDQLEGATAADHGPLELVEDRRGLPRGLFRSHSCSNRVISRARVWRGMPRCCLARSSGLMACPGSTQGHRDSSARVRQNARRAASGSV